MNCPIHRIQKVVHGLLSGNQFIIINKARDPGYITFEFPASLTEILQKTLVSSE